ncbi:uncharacterized protein [Oscarella lobularis]|uniref:uncharacterized protein isoform X2 n=1 Tax=Oscarella lobularis TaxID=121494 RepID=UPI00331371FE
MPNNGVRPARMAMIVRFSPALCFFLFAFMRCTAAQENIEIPAIRVPSVPLIVHDPYLSIWSSSDNLTSTWTSHWTGKSQAIFSLIRVDGTTYRLIGPPCVTESDLDAFTQVGYPQVYPLRTIYTYEGAGVRLRLTFNTPKVAYDFDWFRPTTFVEFNMWSTDNRNHTVAIYFDVTSQLAVNSDNEPVESFRVTTPNNLIDLRIGTKQPQKVLDKAGDDVRINWGYAHLAFSPKGYYWTSDFVISGWIGNVIKSRNMFATSGLIPDTDEPATGQSACTNKEDDHVCDCDQKSDWPGMAAATEDILVTPSDTPSYYPKTWVYFLVAYDDSPASFSFFDETLEAYWRQGNREPNQPMTIVDLIDFMYPAYINFTYMTQSFDTMLVKNLIIAGGMDYAVLASLAYRQTLGASLSVWYDGKFGSKTSAQSFLFSKGCSNKGHTASVVDNFPAMPLYLYYNNDAISALLRPIFMFANNETYGDFLSKFPRNITYSESYCPHFLGEYPIAALQCWYDDNHCNPMPIEATADVLLMLAGASLSRLGAPPIVRDYFALLTQFAEYLVANGLDPVAQPSFDYPDGGVAHDANLAMKAIIAIGAYAKLCSIIGFKECESTYSKLASDYASKWMKMADDGDHYRLAYDQPGTWSLKYNLVWDQFLQTKLFPQEVYDKEIDEYQRHIEQFGWPLDSNQMISNLGWIGWIDAFVNDTVHYQLMAKLLQWVQETPQRVPLADSFDVVDGNQHKYQARAQVGGLFARLLLQNPPPIREPLRRFVAPWSKSKNDDE